MADESPGWTTTEFMETPEGNPVAEIVTGLVRFVVIIDTGTAVQSPT
jgi:hypothetical protein